MTLRADSRSFNFTPMARFGMRAVPALCFLILAGPALAEVCDKAVGERWMPSDGPVWLFNPAGFPIGLTLLIGWLLLSLMTRRSELGFFGVAVIAIFFALTLIPSDGDKPIHEAMLREGCISERTEIWNAFIIGAFALAYLATAIRFWRPRAKTV